MATEGVTRSQGTQGWAAARAESTATRPASAGRASPNMPGAGVMGVGGGRTCSRPLDSECAGPGEAGFVGEHDCLHAVAELEFSEEVSDVSFHGRLADDQFVGDLDVGQAPGEEFEDVEFARGEPGQLGNRSASRWRPAYELDDQAAGDLGCQQGVPGRNGVNRGDQLVGWAVLEDEPARARLEGVEDVLIEVERRQYQHAYARGGGEDTAGGLEAAGGGGSDVHPDHPRGGAPARPRRLRFLHRLRGGLAPRP